MRKRILIFVLTLFALVIFTGCYPSTPTSYSSRSSYSSNTTTHYTPKPTTRPAPTSSATMGEQNALKSAMSYLRLSTGFSRKGLIDQLKYEGYSNSEAEYAVNNCGANWKEQAVKSAAAYLKLDIGFSRTKLIEQLEYEGFTHEQAVYGAEQNGY